MHLALPRGSRAGSSTTVQRGRKSKDGVGIAAVGSGDAGTTVWCFIGVFGVGVGSAASGAGFALPLLRSTLLSREKQRNKIFEAASNVHAVVAQNVFVKTLPSRLILGVASIGDWGFLSGKRIFLCNTGTCRRSFKSYRLPSMVIKAEGAQEVM